MASVDLPDCGIYRTTNQIAGIPAERLVYFHNHGDPGPGLYLPEEWNGNVVQFSHKGRTVQDLALIHTLEPLRPEGLYRVLEEFTCCEKRCHSYATEQLVQLGYNAAGNAMLFVPRWTTEGIVFPERGHVIDADRIDKLGALKIAGRKHHGAHRKARDLH